VVQGAGPGIQVLSRPHYLRGSHDELPLTAVVNEDSAGFVSFHAPQSDPGVQAVVEAILESSEKHRSGEGDTGLPMLRELTKLNAKRGLQKLWPASGAISFEEARMAGGLALRASRATLYALKVAARGKRSHEHAGRDVMIAGNGLAFTIDGTRVLFASRAEAIADLIDRIDEELPRELRDLSEALEVQTDLHGVFRDRKMIARVMARWLGHESEELGIERAGFSIDFIDADRARAVLLFEADGSEKAELAKSSLESAASALLGQAANDGLVGTVTAMVDGDRGRIEVVLTGVVKTIHSRMAAKPSGG
jgi:hypothetical protein